MSMSSRRGVSSGGSGGGGLGGGDHASDFGLSSSSSPSLAELQPLTQQASADDDATTAADRQSAASGLPKSSPSRSSSGNLLRGTWKDSTWNCFRYGCFHPSLCHPCCCLPLAAAQVMTRLNLNGWGHPIAVTTIGSSSSNGSRSSGPVGYATKSVFATVLVLVASFWITRLFLLLIIAILDPNVDSEEWVEPGMGYYFFCAVDDLLALAYFLGAVFLVRNVRRSVRHKYSIPEGDNCPAGCEDTCCSLFCGACVASQLLRQTADYETTPARCCTETGLPGSIGGAVTSSPTASPGRGHGAGAVEMV